MRTLFRSSPTSLTRILTLCFALPAMLATVVLQTAVASEAVPQTPLSGDDLPRVVLTTRFGDIVLEIDTRRAPVSAANFLRHVDDGHYGDATFYRTVTLDNDNGQPKIEVIQGGIGQAAEPPYPPIRHEPTVETGLKHLHGTLSMARGAAGTAASEVCICIGAQPGLDHGASRNADGLGFAAFGRVVEGMDVVHQIHGLPADAPTDDAYVQGQLLSEPAVIERAYRVR